jgi:nucleotide-binding universal stress UspA family protein
MSILCPTDFSTCSREGASVAARLSARHDTTLFLVHVATPVKQQNREALAASVALEAEARRLTELGAQVTPVLCVGEPREEILDFIACERPALLVAGAPAHEPPRQVVRGTLPRVAQSGCVPVLTVRASEPFEAWLRGERALRVMLGVDRTGSFEAARDWLLRFARLGPLKLDAVRVYWPPNEARRLGLPPGKSALEGSPELLDALERELAAQVAPIKGVSLRARLVVGLGHTGTHLVEAAEEAGIDLLIVGSHRRRALGKLVSVSHYAMRSARVAVTAIPTREWSASVSNETRWPALGHW